MPALRLRFLIAAVTVVLAGAAPAGATAPATLFDAPGQVHAWHCATPASAWEPLRFADASETGFGVTNSFSFDDPRCPSATVRLDLHESIPSTAGPLVFHRGGNGYVDDQNVKYGELATADLAGTLPAAVASSGGRGAPCQLAADAPWVVEVESINSAMKYKRPQDVASGNNSGASFLHYGDPGADQGDRDDIHYSYLIWSFVDVRGGGHVRTLLKPRQVVRLCDVEPISMPAWDRSGNVNGEVTARYVQTHAGGCPLYGWMVWQHDYYGDSTGMVSHAVRPGSTAPGSITPGSHDPACPVAEPASAPVATTGDASPGGANAVLSGTVNQKGVPTTWWFEYGPDASYGRATPAQPFGSTTADRVLPVSAPIEGLAAGTEYHYRLVASSAHGTTYGPDRVLTTPAPPAPPVEPPAVQPAAVVLPSLRSLRLSPATFKRKRSHRGAASQIWVDSAVPGTVKLTFYRLVRGRWVVQRGTVTKRVSAGRRPLGFSGWVGTRKLPAGKYRLRAVPYDAEGRVGAARHARFTLR